MANHGSPPATGGYSIPPIPPDYIENGRLYHGFRKGQYMYPCDEHEKDKMDIMHKFFLVARHDVLHSTPYTPNYDLGPRVLDLGTGTGIWAIDMADKYRNGDVRGLDLACIQPKTIPHNLSFSQRDFEAPWLGMGLDSWDLIHLRLLNGSIQSITEIYQRIFMHLKPGVGWIEHVEMDFIPRCDDDTLPADSLMLRWANLIIEASTLAYRPISYNEDTGRMLEERGFVDVGHEIIKTPLNPWPTDPHPKSIGRWLCLTMSRAIEGMTLGPLTRVKGWTAEEVRSFCTEVKKEICNKQIHVYYNMHIWIGRRPEPRVP